ncbi:MAG: molybdenum cofactor guanylyltransferase [Streptosporangiaceae bacterium]
MSGPPGSARQRGSGQTTSAFGMIVLAGGRATRLGGADKPGLTVGGRTLLDAVLAAGSEAGARQAVIVGPPRPGAGRLLDGPPLRFVREEPPGAGPVPALRRGLAELGHPADPAYPAYPADPVAAPWLAVLAADLPFLRVAHLRALLAAAAGEDGARHEGAGHDGAVLTDDEGRAQWLAGCWRTAALRRAAGGYSGASLHGLLAPLRPASVRITPGPGEPPPWLDCDTEADLRRARGWPGAAGQGASPGTTTLRSGSPAANRCTCSATNRAASG